MPQKYTKLIQCYEKYLDIDGKRFDDVESARIYCAELCNNGSKPDFFNFYSGGKISPERKIQIKNLKEAVNAILNFRINIFQ